MKDIKRNKGNKSNTYKTRKAAFAAAKAAAKSSIYETREGWHVVMSPWGIAHPQYRAGHA